MSEREVSSKEFKFDDKALDIPMDEIGELEEIDMSEFNDKEKVNTQSDSELDSEFMADDNGIVVKDDMLSEDEYDTVPNDANFISDTGDIVVMDTSERGENFKFLYVDIQNIAIVPRIRKNNNVDDLVKSIKSTGLLMPVVVAPTSTDGIYVLLNGYRRLMACARAGIRDIPCVVNMKVNTPEIPILEAIYNHNKSYSIKEIVDYIDYLEKQKGILSASMIEYLLQLNTGDYTKLKDILNDNDDDIVSKLYDGIYTIDAAFKKLEQRRKKESAEEKDLKKASKVYENEEASGADNIVGSGEEAGDEALSEEDISNLAISAKDLDNGLDEASLDEMVKHDKDIPGFEAHKQKVGEREYIDPIIRKTVMARDDFTCACCRKGGESYVDALDYHHMLPVFLGGVDTPENGITLCLTCHRLVHLYSTDDLHLPAEKTEEEFEALSEEEKVLYKDEQMRFKRIVRLGGIIREGMAMKGIKKDKFKKEHPIGSIGRNKPGKIQEAT